MLVRPSAVAGQFYPGNADRLRKQVSDLLDNIAMPVKNIPKALIADWASLGPHQACGSRALAGLLIETGRRGLKIRRLSLCNSGDTAGSRDRVVGYGAWMFAQTAA